METAKQFLANEILVEQQVITYRYMSRALKIHVNAAKKALYDFHKSQNAKKPGSVQATYLLYGTKSDELAHAQQEHGDGDFDMASSLPEAVPYSDHAPLIYLTLVAEVNLEAVLKNYDTLASIQIYSLSSQPLLDLQELADTARKIKELGAEAVPDDASKVYGSIPNSHVRRRQRKAQFPTAAAAALVSRANTTTTAASAAVRKPAAAGEPSETKSHLKTGSSKAKEVAKEKDDGAKKSVKFETQAAESPAPEAKKAAAAPPKKGGGGIMQAFAKGAATAKPKKKEEQAKPKKVEEEDDLVLSDDGMDDDDDDILPRPQAVATGRGSLSERKKREEELRRMMERDDDEDADSAKEEDQDEREDTPMEDVDMSETVEPAAAAPKPQEPAEVVAESTGNGRRRGKRRVTRKKMIEDENGYLVTIQEEAWESFSEDEAPPSKPAPVVAAPAPKAKKPVGKGQGNIMSFFSKK